MGIHVLLLIKEPYFPISLYNDNNLYDIRAYSYFRAPSGPALLIREV